MITAHRQPVLLTLGTYTYNFHRFTPHQGIAPQLSPIHLTANIYLINKLTYQDRHFRSLCPYQLIANGVMYFSLIVHIAFIIFILNSQVNIMVLSIHNAVIICLEMSCQPQPLVALVAKGYIYGQQLQKENQYLPEDHKYL